MATQTVGLKVDVRETSGSNASIRLRKDGKLPAVVYGHKQASVSIAINKHDFVTHLHHGNRLFDVELGDKKATLLLKDVQYDHLGKEVIHADLIRVDLSERVTVEVALDFRGVAVGTTMGGMLEESLTQLQIECAVTDIPDLIAVVVRDLGLNESLHARDIALPDGCTLVTEPDALVVICHESKVAAAVDAEDVEGEGAEGSAEPEVITERKQDDGASK